MSGFLSAVTQGVEACGTAARMHLAMSDEDRHEHISTMVERSTKSSAASSACHSRVCL